MEDSHIGSISLFAGLSEEERHHLAARMQRKDYGEGEVIFEARKPSDGLYIVEAGSVALVRRVATGTTVLAGLGVGELLGGEALLLGRPHFVTAEAATDVTVHFLAKADLEALLEEHPSIGLKLTLALGARVVHLDEYLVKERLKGIPLLVTSPEEALKGIAARLRLEIYEEGRFIYQAGEVPHSLYIIEDGVVGFTAMVGGGAGSYVELGEGGIFGQEALLAGNPYIETAQAETRVALWALGQGDLEDLLVRFPFLEETLSRHLPVVEPDLTRKTRIFLRDLERNPLFSDLSLVEMEDVMERLRSVSYKAGDLICVEGKPGRAMYFIETGQTKATTLEAQLAEMPPTLLGAGDFFGGMALLTGNPYEMTVQAATDLKLWTLLKEEFDDLIVQYPLLALSFGRTLGKDLGATLREERQAEPTVQPQPEEAPAAPVKRAPRWRPRFRWSLRGFKEAFGEATRWFGRQSLRAKVSLILMVILLLWILAISLPMLAASAFREGGIGEGAVPPQLEETPVATLVSGQGREQPTAFVRTPAVPTRALPTYTPQPTASPTLEPLAVVKVGTLNLRSGPGTGYVALVLLYEGDEVKILGQLPTAEWLRVATRDDLEGWVYAAFVEANVPTAAIPTVAPPGY